MAIKGCNAVRIRPVDAARTFIHLVRRRDVSLGGDFLEATTGNSTAIAFARFSSSTSGRRLLVQRPSILELLKHEAMLAALPNGALGRCFHDHIVQAGLSVEGVAELTKSYFVRPMAEQEQWVVERRRDIHDLRHVLTGYGVDDFGELCLLTFRCAQTWHFGMAFLSLLGGLKFTLDYPGQPVWRALLEAWRHGRKATWLEDLEWESLLAEPVSLLRERLHVCAPDVYGRVLAGARAQGRVHAFADGAPRALPERMA